MGREKGEKKTKKRKFKMLPEQPLFLMESHPWSFPKDS